MSKEAVKTEDDKFKDWHLLFCKVWNLRIKNLEDFEKTDENVINRYNKLVIQYNKLFETDDRKDDRKYFTPIIRDVLEKASLFDIKWNNVVNCGYVMELIARLYEAIGEYAIVMNGVARQLRYYTKKGIRTEDPDKRAGYIKSSLEWYDRLMYLTKMYLCDNSDKMCKKFIKGISIGVSRCGCCRILPIGDKSDISNIYNFPSDLLYDSPFTYYYKIISMLKNDDYEKKHLATDNISPAYVISKYLTKKHDIDLTQLINIVNSYSIYEAEEAMSKFNAEEAMSKFNAEEAKEIKEAKEAE